MQKNVDVIFSEINYDINLLYITPYIYTKNVILNHLRDRISMLEDLVTQPSALPQAQPAASLVATGTRVFTPEELAGYDGKNGRPAYVAANGVVYDVTNNAAWAAATHFGLSAGKDLSGPLNSCHAGQDVLNKLIAVGTLGGA